MSAKITVKEKAVQLKEKFGGKAADVVAEILEAQNVVYNATDEDDLNGYYFNSFWNEVKSELKKTAI